MGTMDPAYLSALAALAGSTIGGLTSLATSWLTQHTQFEAQQRTHETSTREELYKDFIEEASKLYADAYEHSEGNTAQRAINVPPFTIRKSWVILDVGLFGDVVKSRLAGCQLSRLRVLLASSTK